MLLKQLCDLLISISVEAMTELVKEIEADCEEDDERIECVEGACFAFCSFYAALRGFKVPNIDAQELIKRHLKKMSPPAAIVRRK